MSEDAFVTYGPRECGVPAWEVRQEGRLFVLSYQGGPVRLTFTSRDEAVAWARRWHAARGER